MVACDVIRVLTVGLMAVPGMPFWSLCALLFCTVLLGAPFSLARSALIPDVVSARQVATAPVAGNLTYQRARSSASPQAPRWLPPSGAIERWELTPFRSEYPL
jgi:hypothetical protein